MFLLGRFEKNYVHIALMRSVCCYSKLQIRGGIEDNSRIIFLINKNICCNPSLEPSLMTSHNIHFKGVIINMENYPEIIPFTPSYLEH